MRTRRLKLRSQVGSGSSWALQLIFEDQSELIMHTSYFKTQLTLISIRFLPVNKE